jgi:hypothetical protein
MEPRWLRGVPVKYVFVFNTLVAVFAGPQVDQQDLHLCGIKFTCQFDWKGSGYDELVPFLERLHVRKDFWKNWRRSTNVEIAGQGRYRP